jgi:molybdenum cofactor biosynthesis protein B
VAYDQHTSAAKPISARCAVITLSDTRTAETDTSGKRIRELLEADGHAVVTDIIIKDDPATLAELLDAHLRDDETDVILTNGGTGISRRDNTIAVVESKLTLPLPGFGELFRMLSWEQIGSGAMLSRAVGGVAGVAGVAGDKLIFAMPGSTKAVDLAMTKLILPELRHLLFELRK